jgi:hypothetical protein
MMSFGGKGASIGMKKGLVRSSNWKANVQSYTPLSVAPKRASTLASLRVQLWGTGKKKTMTGASGSDPTGVEAQAQAEAVAAEEQAAWVKPVLVAGGVAALLGVAYYLGKKRK